MRGGTEFLIYVPYLCFYLVVCGELPCLPALPCLYPFPRSPCPESYGRATKLMLSAWVRVRNGLAGSWRWSWSWSHTRLSHTIPRRSYTHTLFSSPAHTHTFTHIKYHPWRVISIPRAVFISVFISCFLHKRHSPTQARVIALMSRLLRLRTLSPPVCVCYVNGSHFYVCSRIQLLTFQCTEELWHRTQDTPDIHRTLSE